MSDDSPAHQVPSKCPANDKEDVDNSTSPAGASQGAPTAGTVVAGSSSGSSSKKKFRTADFRKKNRSKQKDASIQKRKKLATWSLSKLNCSFGRIPSIDIAEPTAGCSACICTGYRRTEDHHLGAGIVFKPSSSSPSSTSGMFRSDSKRYVVNQESEPVIDLSKFNPEDFPIEDCDERARRERAREMEEGVDPPPGYHPHQRASDDLPQLTSALRRVSIAGSVSPSQEVREIRHPFVEQPITPAAIFHQHTIPCIVACSNLMNRIGQLPDEKSYIQHTVHTQVDYIHCLVPDILSITNCSFYWGKMDQYEAERLLENKPEGTFLLRDSAQEDYLFSVSFRRYGRSLHARIEQWNHKFSFDAHDPGVFASSSVCGLIEHYKDPSRCMFFEPMLTIPLHRSFTFSLQHLCRSTVGNNIEYDGINKLPMPKSLKAYLKEYHYKQRVRIRLFDSIY